MSKYVFVVMTNPTEGQEDAYNAWYDDQHLPDVLKVEGFTAAQRFRLAPIEAGNPNAPYRYLALYEVETDDLQKARDALTAVAGTEAMPMSPALDAGISAIWYQAAGERRLAG